jgi:uncharacterized protein with HEPN domain
VSPPGGGRAPERGTEYPDTSQGHMPVPAWRSCRARRIAPERYAKCQPKIIGKIIQKNIPEKLKKILTFIKKLLSYIIKSEGKNE